MLNYWLALSVLGGIGLTGKHKLLKTFGSPDKVFEENIRKVDFPRIRGDIDLAAQKNVCLESAENIIDKCEKEKAKIICFDDEDYPRLLKNIGASAPLVIYCKGSSEVLSEKNVVIVGTREPNVNGQKDARLLSSQLAQNGFVIVSGLARGVDTIAHNSALEAGGKTVSVMATGIDMVTPTQNIELAKRIVDNGGAVITEQHPGKMPYAPNFAQRDRIISGLSQCTIVVSAPEKSGALITADFAERQGRKVFVVPGTISDEKYKGSNRLLLKKIVDPALTIEGILAYINGTKNVEQISIFDVPQKVLAPVPNKRTDYTEEQETLLSFLSAQPIGIETLSERSGISIDKLYGILFELEIEGIVLRTAQEEYYC